MSPVSRDALIHEPRWRAGDLGAPLPDSPHAVSVCLPTWRDIVDYEEGAPRIDEALRAGYPRFFLHRHCRELFDRLSASLGEAGEGALAFGSTAAATRAAGFVRAEGGEARVVELDEAARRKAGLAVEDREPVTALLYSGDAPSRRAAMAAWRHGGEGLSSRAARRLLGEPLDVEVDPLAGDEVRIRVAQHADVAPEDVWLAPTGMAAVLAVFRAAARVRPGGRFVQFGFPYVDTLKVLQRFGRVPAIVGDEAAATMPEPMFLPAGGPDELARLEAAIDAGEPIAAVFTEAPSNPLLATPDLPRLAAACRRAGAALVVDDTIATWCNLDAFPLADLSVTSLTKSFSGAGDVAAGCVIVRPGAMGDAAAEARWRGAMAAMLEPARLDPADASVLAQNSRDFAGRVARATATAEALAHALAARDDVLEVYHPSVRHREAFDVVRKQDGGYGSLMSILLREPERRTPAFYDALPLCKGPNLGADFTLVCPYTMIAHYDELDAVEALGVSRWLIRIAVGLEPFDRLRDAIFATLDAV